MAVIAATGWVRHGLVALCLSAALPALAAECPTPHMSNGPARVEFSTSVADPVYRNDRARAEMTASVAPSLGTPEVEKSGVTAVETGFEVFPRFEWVALPGGRACVALQEVRTNWRITAIMVDVAAEYRPGSCQYREVRVHEEEHVRTNLQTFREFAPRMEARLRTVAHDIRPMATQSDPDQAMQAMLQRLTEAARSVQAAYDAALRERNAVIDTPESYRAVSKRCERW